MGEEVFLVSETKAYCKSVRIESIMDEQKENKQIIDIDIVNEQEIGLKFNSSAKKGLSIFQYVQKCEDGESKNDDL
ncbi:hypothetical protein VB715_21390 [Crocosphaera sp. UHCC 0190]|uniref:hypothetical protein n=1 Tax=Crocosphaera sp. UHCC 0190 TaxID=3110246 RepID=UPI002B1F6DEB|nr:hypothetical protein [Crocosphaera sp. UHCC 0190]MEA5512331.1 hypothetical protein [Crocosphaera sp. UHCC 0190]